MIMRTLGLLLLVGGVFGFVYTGDQLAKAPPLPEDVGWRQALEYPAGKWDMARYGCAIGSGVGILMLLFPKGR
jgi:hypothetical protein